jgi:hypothetical protein
MDALAPDPNTTNLSEGELDPGLKKRIRVLIQRRPDYIVYLDDDLYVQWKLPGKDVEACGPHAHEILNEVGLLETLSVPLRSTTHLVPVRRLLAEAVARTFSGGPESEKAARKMLLDARTYLNDRKAEMARIWMLSAAGVFALLALLVMLVVWLNRVALEQWFSPQIVETVYGAGLGALGAFMSLLMRSAKIKVAAGAGRAIHYVEALSRVAIGAVGAVLVVLAVRANLLLGIANSAGGDSSLLYLLCLVSGVSESLMPGLIAQVEAAATGARSAAGSDGEHKI